LRNLWESSWVLVISFLILFIFNIPTGVATADTPESYNINQKVEELDKNLAVLQNSVTSHLSEQESEHFTARIAVLEVKMTAVDSKLSVILGTLIALFLAIIGEFIHRTVLANNISKMNVNGNK
jgi:hypothetical protein